MALFGGSNELRAKLDALDKSQAIIEFDLDGNIVAANGNFLKLMGYGLDGVKGKHHRMFVDPAFAETADYRVFWDKLKAGEYHSGHYKRLAKGGQPVWIQGSYNPVLSKNGKPYKVIKIASDITTEQVRTADFEG